jgi:diguanylate cyclase (GGDEF)-like protein
VRSTPFTAGGGAPLRITVSVGAAVFPRHGRTASELMRSADQAMYAVKAAGRDGWAVATRTAPSAEPGESSGPWAGPPAG